MKLLFKEHQFLSELGWHTWVGVLAILVVTFLYWDGLLGVFGVGMVYLLHEMRHGVSGILITKM